MHHYNPMNNDKGDYADQLIINKCLLNEVSDTYCFFSRIITYIFDASNTSYLFVSGHCKDVL